MTTMYRAVVFIKNLNGDTPTKESVKQQLESNRYPEFVDVFEVEETDIGKWHDDHELNQKMTLDLALSYFPLQHQDVDYMELGLKKEYNRVKGIMLKTIKEVIQKEQEIRDLKDKLKKYEKFDDIMKQIKELK